MYPFSIHVLREYQRLHAEKNRREQRRIRNDPLDANGVTAEGPPQGRLAAAVSRLRKRWTHRPAPLSQPIEPTGA